MQVSFLLYLFQNVEVSDTRADAISTAAGNQIILLQTDSDIFVINHAQVESTFARSFIECIGTRERI